MRLTQIVERPGKGNNGKALRAESRRPGSRLIVCDGRQIALPLRTSVSPLQTDLSETLPALTHDDSVSVKDYAEAGICANHCPDCFHTPVDPFVSHDDAMK